MFIFIFFKIEKNLCSIVLLFRGPCMEMKMNVMFTSNGHSFPFHISGPVVDIVPPNAFYGIISWYGLDPVSEVTHAHFFQVFCRIEVGLQWYHSQVPRLPGTGSKWVRKFGGQASTPCTSVISDT